MSVLASSGVRLASEECWRASGYDGCGRGHAGTGRRWRTRYYGERSASDEPLLVLNPEPVPPAPLPPPEPVVLAAIPQDTDLPTLHERVARLETEAARRARRRREEEEILRFLLRVA